MIIHMKGIAISWNIQLQEQWKVYVTIEKGRKEMVDRNVGHKQEQKNEETEEDLSFLSLSPPSYRRLWAAT